MRKFLQCLLLVFISNHYAVAHASFWDAIAKWAKGVAECKGNIYVHHSSEPVLTVGAGGLSSRSNPKIKLKYEGCFSIVGKFTGQIILDANPLSNKVTDSMNGYTYVTAVVGNDNVCKNKCIFGVLKGSESRCGFSGETGEINDAVSGVTCIALKSSEAFKSRRCDYQLTAQYLTLCEQSNEKNVVGICGYHSNLPNALSDFVNFWDPYGPIDVMGYKAESEFYKNTKNLFSAANQDKKGYCFPLTLLPMPQPFCNWHEQKQVDLEFQTSDPSSDQPVFSELPTVAYCDNVSESSLCVKISSPDLGKLYTPQNNITSCQISLDIETGDIKQYTCPDEILRLAQAPACVGNVNKVCLTGFPPPKNMTSNLCYSELCVDLYPFKIDCSKTEVMSGQCETDVKEYCFKINSDKRGYSNFDECLTMREKCVTDFRGLPCETLKKVAIDW